MDKKKILIAAYSLDFGGIETSLVNLLKNLDYEKYEVMLVLEKKEGVFLGDIPNNIGIREYRVSESKNVFVRKFINFFKQLRWKFLNNNRYDSSICYATYSKPCSFLARTSSKNPILFVHSNYYQIYGKDENLTRKFFDGVKINEFRSIVFVSNESRNDLIRIYDIADKSFVINNLIDYKRIEKLSKVKIDLPSFSGKVFLFVGRLEESSKKVSRILEVARLCKKQSLGIQFWIVGDGPDRSEYLKFQKKYKLDNVIFFGAQKNPYPYIKRCNYLILTSSYEGFPVVYNEAIALGKYILTTVNVSDDYVCIPDRFGIVADNDISDIFDKLLYLYYNDIQLKEIIDFEKLNKRRIKKIEEILERRND